MKRQVTAVCSNCEVHASYENPADFQKELFNWNRQ